MTSEPVITETVGTYVSAAFVVCYGFIFWRGIVRQRLISSLNCIEDRRKTRSRGLTLFYWASPIFFASLWGLASYSGLASSQTIPSPEQFGRSFWDLTLSGTLVTEAFISFNRVLLGFAAATLVGVPLGLMAGTFVVARGLIGPTTSFFRYIPPTAFIALLIVYFGVGEQFKYSVVFLGVVFFITQMVTDVVDDMDSRYVEIALTSGLSNSDVFLHVIIPFCWPRIFDVLRINLSAAWTFLVAAELIGAERGLGHFIAISQRFLRMGDLYTGIVAFGIIGLLTDFGLELLSHRLFRWHYTALKRSRNSQMPISRDVTRFRELASIIQNPASLTAANDSSIQRLVNGCISRLSALRMGGRSASIVGLSVVLWTQHRRGGIRLDVEKTLSLCFKIARDPSYIQPEWAVVLAGTIIARYSDRLEQGRREEVLDQCRAQLKLLEADAAHGSSVCMAARSLVEAWKSNFKFGLNSVVQSCLEGWPSTADVQSVADIELNEIIRVMNKTLPSMLTERDRSLYRLYLERKGEWRLLELITLK